MGNVGLNGTTSLLWDLRVFISSVWAFSSFLRLSVESFLLEHLKEQGTLGNGCSGQKGSFRRFLSTHRSVYGVSVSTLLWLQEAQRVVTSTVSIILSVENPSLGHCVLLSSQFWRREGRHCCILKESWYSGKPRGGEAIVSPCRPVFFSPVWRNVRIHLKGSKAHTAPGLIRAILTVPLQTHL